MPTCQSIFQAGRWGINKLQRAAQIARSSVAPRAAYPSGSAAPIGGYERAAGGLRLMTERNRR